MRAFNAKSARARHAAGFDMELTTTDGEKQLEHADDANVLALRWFELEERLKRDGSIKST